MNKIKIFNLLSENIDQMINHKIVITRFTTDLPWIPIRFFFVNSLKKT